MVRTRQSRSKTRVKNRTRKLNRSRSRQRTKQQRRRRTKRVNRSRTRRVKRSRTRQRRTRQNGGGGFTVNDGFTVNAPADNSLGDFNDPRLTANFTQDEVNEAKETQLLNPSGPMNYEPSSLNDSLYLNKNPSIYPDRYPARGPLTGVELKGLDKKHEKRKEEEDVLRKQKSDQAKDWANDNYEGFKTTKEAPIWDKSDRENIQRIQTYGKLDHEKVSALIDLCVKDVKEKGRKGFRKRSCKSYVLNKVKKLGYPMIADKFNTDNAQARLNANQSRQRYRI